MSPFGTLTHMHSKFSVHAHDTCQSPSKEKHFQGRLTLVGINLPTSTEHRNQPQFPLHRWHSVNHYQAMATMTTALQSTYHPHPSSLYPVVEDISELEYGQVGCCPCDENGTILNRFPLRDIAFPATQPLETLYEEKKHHYRRSSSSSSSALKRRSSRGSSFDDEITVNTETEEPSAKFEDSFVLTRQVRDLSEGDDYSWLWVLAETSLDMSSHFILAVHRFSRVPSLKFGNAYTELQECDAASKLWILID